jgi:hypothetical protein
VQSIHTCLFHCLVCRVEILEVTFSVQVSFDVFGSRETVIGIVTRLRAGQPRDRGSILCRDKMSFSSPKHPERLCGPPSLLLTAYRGLLFRG